MSAMAKVPVEVNKPQRQKSLTGPVGNLLILLNTAINNAIL